MVEPIVTGMLDCATRSDSVAAAAAVLSVHPIVSVSSRTNPHHLASLSL